MVTTCIVLDEFDEGVPIMINSDLIADSLDYEDEEDGYKSNLQDSLEECKDEVNTPSILHKGSGT